MGGINKMEACILMRVITKNHKFRPKQIIARQPILIISGLTQEVIKYKVDSILPEIKSKDIENAQCSVDYYIEWPNYIEV